MTFNGPAMLARREFVENTEKMLEVAKEAAYEAGEIQLSYMGKNKQIEHKANKFDLVTEADKQSEDKILSIINTYFPKHDILGEETGCHNEHNSDYLWVIDPLDGTTNFTHNFPHFAVSIGLIYKGKIIMGVVYDSCKNELFWAAEGAGAYLNSEPIKTSQAKNLGEGLLATGFPPSKSEKMEENFVYFKRFIKQAQAIRRPGSAALDLCYVACGRLDGFWELSLSPWDVTAGACIVREAGGKVTNFDSEEFDPYTKTILATNTFLHDTMKEVINE